MTELFNIEPTPPKWKQLADVHGITTGQNRETGTWKAEYDDFDETESESGETEREAVVALIHRLGLSGWEGVSV